MCIYVHCKNGLLNAPFLGYSGSYRHHADNSTCSSRRYGSFQLAPNLIVKFSSELQLASPPYLGGQCLSVFAWGWLERRFALLHMAFGRIFGHGSRFEGMSSFSCHLVRLSYADLQPTAFLNMIAKPRISIPPITSFQNLLPVSFLMGTTACLNSCKAFHSSKCT